jgi:hypothetical protein
MLRCEPKVGGPIGESQGSKNVVLMKNNKLDESFISEMRDEE